MHAPLVARSTYTIRGVILIILAQIVLAGVARESGWTSAALLATRQLTRSAVVALEAARPRLTPIATVTRVTVTPWPCHAHFAVTVGRTVALACIILAHLAHESVRTITATRVECCLPAHSPILAHHVLAMLAPGPQITRRTMALGLVLHKRTTGSVMAVLAAGGHGNLTSLTCPLARALAL